MGITNLTRRCCLLSALLGISIATSAQTPPPADLPLTIAPYHADGVYQLGQTVGWTVKAKDGAPIDSVNYTVRRNNQTIIKTGVLNLSSAPAILELQADQPEMLLVELTQSSAPSPTAAKAAPQKTLLGAAVSPLNLQPSISRPSDFLTFWHSQLTQLATVPIHPQTAPVSSPYKEALMSTVMLDSLGSHVQGFLARPAHPGKFPAILVYQWAGVYKLNPKVAAGYARDGWLAFNVDSHDMAPTDEDTAPADYASIGDNDREKSYFLKMFLRDTRALDYITTLPDWDGKTIVLTGVSMGGWQSLVTAALNPTRVTAVIVNEPAGLDTNADLHGRKAGYPYWPSNDPAVMYTALYFDPVNFAPEIRASTIIGAGFIDTTAPPAGIYTGYNQISSPKQFIPLVDAGHHDAHPAETQAAYGRRAAEALKSLLHTGTLTLP